LVRCNGEKQLFEAIKANAKECFGLIDADKDFALLVDEENGEDYEDDEYE
jgi:hypothetical protein